MMHMREPPEPPRTLRAGIPKSIEAAVMKALDKDPDARFQSPLEFKRALATSSGAGTTAVFERPQVHHDPPKSAEDRAPSALRWVLPVVALIAAAVAAAILVPPLLEDDPAPGEDRRGPRTGSAAI